MDEHRLSFGKIESPEKYSKKYNHESYYENSSPIKKVQNVSDLESKFTSRNSFSPSKFDRENSSYLPRQTDYSQLRGVDLGKYSHFDSPTKSRNFEVGNIDRMQSKIQSMLKDKAIRY